MYANEHAAKHDVDGVQLLDVKQGYPRGHYSPVP